MNIQTLIASGYILGIIIGYIGILIYNWNYPRQKERQYRKELSQNSVFWEPLDWK